MFSERNKGCNSAPHMLMVKLMSGGWRGRWEMLCPAILLLLLLKLALIWLDGDWIVPTVTQYNHKFQMEVNKRRLETIVPLENSKIFKETEKMISKISVSSSLQEEAQQLQFPFDFPLFYCWKPYILLLPDPGKNSNKNKIRSKKRKRCKPFSWKATVIQHKLFPWNLIITRLWWVIG